MESLKGCWHFDREQSIYECMIANLFEEYKFFSKYPERQLRIAAVLFGEILFSDCSNILKLLLLFKIAGWLSFLV